MATLSAGLVIAASATAHEVGLSRGDFKLRGHVLKAEVIFARKELASLVAGLDANHDGALTEAEMNAGKDSIEGAVVGRIKVRSAAGACAPKLEGVGLTEQDGALIRARYDCPRGTTAAEVELGFLDDLSFGHRHLARSSGKITTDVILSQREPRFSIEAGPAEPEAEVPRDAPAGPVEALRAGLVAALRFPAAALFALGFLAVPTSGREEGSVVPTSGRRRLLAAGALAASMIGGVIAGLAGFAPDPRHLAIASFLSVAYAAAAHLAPPSPSRRWSALPFGLVHGLVILEAFRDAGLGRAALAPFVASTLIASLGPAGLLAIGFSRLARALRTGRGSADRSRTAP